jgi:hypothetical protein
MKLSKKDLIFLTLGIAAGAAGMFLYGKKKFDAELQSEVDALKEYYDKKDNKTPVGKKVSKQTYSSPKVQNVDREKEDDPRLSKQITDYNKVLEYTKNKQVSYGQTEEGMKERVGEKPPYVISDVEMYEGRPEYDKVTLTYYAGDDTLADEDDYTITDVDLILGTMNLDLFGTECEDPDMLHVRNERLGSDYEIIKTESKYGEVVLNLNEGEDGE